MRHLNCAYMHSLTVPYPKTIRPANEQVTTLVQLHAVGGAMVIGVGVNEIAEIHSVGDCPVFMEVVAADVPLGVAVDVEVLAIRRKRQPIRPVDLRSHQRHIAICIKPID